MTKQLSQNGYMVFIIIVHHSDGWDNEFDTNFVSPHFYQFMNNLTISKIKFTSSKYSLLAKYLKDRLNSSKLKL